ncbi:MAG: hypothetical protein INQ03_25450 [Candidatus Heimdallarchaeota archaeon]|nr:hypothetical protein [Candidatus Heimdallarchaeota archaeon]
MEDPGQILVDATIRSYSSIKRLARHIRSNDMQKLVQSIMEQYDKIMNTWRATRDTFELSLAEPNMRKQFLRLIFESTVKYGNTEFERIQDSDEDIGPLNILFNIGGGLLRVYAEEFYPFPIAEVEIAKKLGFISHKYTFVPVSHPNIPSLDFIDSIRTHLWFLSRHMFIHRVPYYAAVRYFLILMFRCKPYLDYLYAGGGQGKKDIPKNYTSILEMDKHLYDVMRMITLEAETKHAVHRVTQLKLGTTNFLLQDIRGSINNELVDGEKVGDKFYDAVIKLFEKERKRKGTSRHHEIMAGIPSATVKEIVFNGDAYTQDSSGYQVFAEVPIRARSSANLDFVLFKRIMGRNRPLWIPVVILDLKIKIDGLFDYDSVLVKGRKGLWQPSPRVKLTAVDEWDQVVNNALNQHVKNQLSNYSRLLKQEIDNLINYQLPEPMKGVLITRGEMDLRDEVQNVLYSLPKYLKKPIVTDHFLHIDDLEDQMALIFMNTYVDSHALPVVPKPYEPEIVRGTKEVVLYVTAQSNINFGKTAANIAAVYDCISTAVETHGEICVLDTLDVYSEFTQERMRLPQEIIDKLTIIPFDPLEPDYTILHHIKKPVVITGWADSKLMLRKNWDLEKEMVDQIRTTVYLIDRSIRDGNTSRVYHSHCVLPYKHWSQRKSYVSRIIYNLPVPPSRMKKPLYDDVRVIIEDDKHEVKLCPALTGIADKFDQSDSRRKGRERKLENIDIDKVLDLLAWRRQEYKYDRVTLHSQKLGKPGHRQALVHESFIERTHEPNREFRSRNPYSRVAKLQKRTYRIPYSSDFARKRAEPVEMWEPTMLFLRDKYPDLLDGIEDIVDLEQRCGIVFSELMEDDKKKFHQTYCPEIPFRVFCRLTRWYDILFLVFRSQYQMQDTLLLILWRQFSTWMLYTLGYNFQSEIKYIFNVANIFKQIVAKSQHYRHVDGVIRHLEQGVIYLGREHSVIQFEDSTGMFRASSIEELTEPDLEAHPDVIMDNFELLHTIPVCRGVLDGTQYIWIYESWSTVRRLEMLIDYSMTKWNIKRFKLNQCNIEEIPEIDPYIPQWTQEELTYIYIKLEYDRGIVMHYKPRKGDTLKESFIRFSTIEQLMDALRNLYGVRTQALMLDSIPCKIKYRGDISWGIFAELHTFLGMMQVPYDLDHFRELLDMQVEYISVNIGHDIARCREGHPECWPLTSGNMDVDCELDDYRRPEDIINLWYRKSLVVENKLYQLTFSFDDSLVYRENKIIRSIFNQHHLKRHTELKFRTYTREPSYYYLDATHDIKLHQVVFTVENELTGDSTKEIRSYIASTMIEQMYEAKRIIEGCRAKRDKVNEKAFDTEIAKCDAYLEEYLIDEEEYGCSYYIEGLDIDITEDTYQLSLIINEQEYRLPKTGYYTRDELLDMMEHHLKQGELDDHRLALSLADEAKFWIDEHCSLEVETDIAEHFMEFVEYIELGVSDIANRDNLEQYLLSNEYFEQRVRKQMRVVTDQLQCKTPVTELENEINEIEEMVEYLDEEIEGLGMFYKQLGIEYKNEIGQDNVIIAMKYVTNALNLFSIEKNHQEVYCCLYLLGNLEYYTSNFASAKEYYFEARRLENLFDINKISRIKLKLNFGNLYIENNEFDKAKSILEEILITCIEELSDLVKCKVYRHLAYIYRMEKEYYISVEYYIEALILSELDFDEEYLSNIEEIILFMLRENILDKNQRKILEDKLRATNIPNVVHQKLIVLLNHQDLLDLDD